MNIFLLGATPDIRSSSANDPASKLAATGGNTGNQMIAYGLLNQLTYKDISWNYRVDPKEVHERYDVLLIAAANFLYSAFDLGGMADFIERANLPVAIVGLGAQSNNYDPYIQLMAGTERFVKVIAERAASIGVRGPYTRDVLAQRGIHNVTITGCPSYYMSGPEGIRLRRSTFDQVKKISINASRDVMKHSFDYEAMRNVIQQIYRIGVSWNADFIAQSEIAEIAVAEQPSSATIQGAACDLSRLLEGDPPADELRLWIANHARVYFDIEAWLTSIEHYDFVFGSRFHGCMVALQRGVPAVVLCHDTRTEDMCRFLHIPYVSILNINRIDVKGLFDVVDRQAVEIRSRALYKDYREFVEINGLKLRDHAPVGHTD